MATVAIVGAGLMGTAVSFPLCDNGHAVRLVGTHLDGEIITSCCERRWHPGLKREIPATVRPYFVDEMAEALDGAEVIVSGVNSDGVHWIGQALGPHVQPGQVIIAVTKGLQVAENGDLIIFPDVLAGELPSSVRDQVIQAAIGGPCIAGELAGRRESCVFFASRDHDSVEWLAPIFRTPYYHVRTTTDLVPVELCVALKNAYAIAGGWVAGLLEKAGGPDAADAYMHNLAAAIFAQACAEIAYMLQVMGQPPTFAHQLPGAGDLYVTCQGGRNVRLGRLLGLGHTFTEARQMMAGITLEGAQIVRRMGEALPKLQTRGLIGGDDFPLLRSLVDVVVHDGSVNVPLDAFFR